MDKAKCLYDINIPLEKRLEFAQQMKENTNDDTIIQIQNILHSIQTSISSKNFKKVHTIENNRETYVCSSCNYTTTRKSNLDLHFQSQKHKKISTNHNIKSNTNLKCPYCKITFTRKYSLERHIESRCLILNSNKIDKQ